MSLLTKTLLTVALYALCTLAFAVLQAVENRTSKPGDAFWAPVWWIALTWPVWLVAIGLDLPWAPRWPGHRP